MSIYCRKKEDDFINSDSLTHKNIRQVLPAEDGSRRMADYSGDNDHRATAFAGDNGRRMAAFAGDDRCRDRLEALATRLNLMVVDHLPEDTGEFPALCLDETGLSLVGKGLVLQGDFMRMLPRIKTGNLRGELLVRAAKLKQVQDVPLAVDATAGLGEDSFLLAAAGFSVKLFEYNPIIAALLQDALERAHRIPELAAITQRMQVIQDNSITALSKLPAPPDVILLDPMFPGRQKSALVKKKFQLLQLLEHPCTDENDLLQAALNAHPQKIVIKRPAKGPHLAGRKPSYSLQGKGIRYDCIVL